MFVQFTKGALDGVREKLDRFHFTMFNNFGHV